MTISTLMSTVRVRRAVTARRAGIDASDQRAGDETQRSRQRPLERRRRPARPRAPRRQPTVSQNRARTSGARRTRLLVLEPHAHAGLPDGIDHGGRRQLRGVILNVQALADDVGRHRLETRQRLEPPLENDDFLVAVHALDAEDRLRVQLARRARHLGCVAPGLSAVEGMAGGLAAGLLHVTQSLPEQREHVLVVERVENHPAFAPRPDDAGVAQAGGAGARRPIR